ncbi:MAG: hypothetical protein QW688_07310 [Thermoprotei archaeon]
MSLQTSVVPVAAGFFTSTTTVTATASPGTTIASLNVPGLSATWIHVFFTDVQVINTSSSAAVSVTLQIGMIGFGFTSPVYAHIGTSAPNVSLAAGATQLFPGLNWALPQGGAGANLGAGGTVVLAAYASTASQAQVYVSYGFVYAWFGGVV